jgi:hypothetical protein
MAGIESQPGKVGECRAISTKDAFRRNELQLLLTLKELEFFRAKNELVFERNLRGFEPENRRPEALLWQ